MSMAAGDLGVQAVFLRDLPDDDEFLRRDFAAGHARHHRIGAVLLHVRQVVVVGVLQRRVTLLEHELVPARGENRRDRRLADVAAESLAVFLDDCVEGLELANAHEVEQLLTCVWKMFAHRDIDADAALLELGIQQLGDQRRATTAGGARLRLRLQCADGGAARFYGRADSTFGNVVAGAHLCGRRQRGQRIGRGCTRAGRGRRKQHGFGILG
jgi:hypothetical protein